VKRTYLALIALVVVAAVAYLVSVYALPTGLIGALLTASKDKRLRQAGLGIVALTLALAFLHPSPLIGYLGPWLPVP